MDWQRDTGAVKGGMLSESADSLPSSAFPATRWSLIVCLKQGTDDDRQQALAQLCQLYWRPLYAYARKRGFSKPDAEDLTQGFFQQVLSRDSLG